MRVAHLLRHCLQSLAQDASSAPGCAAGLVFTSCSEPYLQSEYGGNYITDSPVKLLDRLLYGQRQFEDEQASSSSALRQSVVNQYGRHLQHVHIWCPSEAPTKITGGLCQRCPARL